LPRPAVTGLSFDPSTAELVVEGLPAGASLVGSRARVEADGSTIGLLASRWGFGPLALPRGTYRVTLADDSTRLDVRSEPLEIRHELFHATAREHAGGLVVDVRAPLDDDERGPAAQRRLERAYRRG